MVRLADKERVFQLLIHRLNLVGDMSLAQFEAWFGPLENVVWDAPPSEDFWMGFRNFMLQEYNPRMPYSCQIRFPEYVEAYMELPAHFSKESSKRPKHSVNNAGADTSIPSSSNPYQSSTGTNAAGTRGGGPSRGGKFTRVGSPSGLMSGSGFDSLRGLS